MLQPIEMGVIKCLKGQYRKLIVMKIFENTERYNYSKKKSQDFISASTIANYFIHANLSEHVIILKSPEGYKLSDLESMLPLVSTSSNSINAAEYIDVNNHICRSEVLNDVDVENIFIDKENDNMNDEDDHTASISYTSAPRLMYTHVVLHTLQTFCMMRTQLVFTNLL